MTHYSGNDPETGCGIAMLAIAVVVLVLLILGLGFFVIAPVLQHLGQTL